MDKLKFMGRPPGHPWGKTGSPESFFGSPNYFDLSLKDICFLVINTKFTWFLCNHVPTDRELGRSSGDFGGHVGSPDRVMSCIWRVGDLLSAALGIHLISYQNVVVSKQNNVMVCIPKFDNDTEQFDNRHQCSRKSSDMSDISDG